MAGTADGAAGGAAEEEARTADGGVEGTAIGRQRRGRRTERRGYGEAAAMVMGIGTLTVRAHRMERI